MLGWIPKAVDPSMASVRYRCLIPLQELQAHGFPVTVYQERDQDCYAGVIFSKLYDRPHQVLARWLKARGASVILDLCDNHFYNPYNLRTHRKAKVHLLRMLEVADLVVCSTPTLADIVEQEAGLPRRPVVVGDPVDGFGIDESRLAGRWTAGSPAALTRDGVPRLVWFGIHGAPNAPCGMLDLLKVADHLLRLVRRHPFELVVVSNDRVKYQRHIARLPWRSRYVEWSTDAFAGLLLQAAAVVIPITLNPFTVCKSNNRLATALSAGVPVVADEIPSYREFADFCCLNDWEGGLEAVFTDYAKTMERVHAGRAYVGHHWSPSAVARQWEKVLAPFVEWSTSPARLGGHST
jgi:glycosyltransferase involved in cell wall biosynthesis